MKTRRKLNKSLVTSICSSVCLLGASAGIVFGISAGAFKIRYLPEGTDVNARISSAYTQNYYNQKITSGWNMAVGYIPTTADIKDDKSAEPAKDSWQALHGDVDLPNVCKNGAKLEYIEEGGNMTEPEAQKRWEYSSMVIDGSTHSTLDRSFNQSLYNGIVNFIQNKDIPTTKLKAESTVKPQGKLLDNEDNYTAASFKPAEDNNIGLANTYKAVASGANQFRMIGLAGFNHCSPLGIIGEVDKSGKFILSKEYQDLANMQMLLIDGNIPNNQYVSSVIFRSDQPGFLTGISTCMYFYNNLQTYHKGYKTLSIGAYGGNPIPTVSIYMGGVQRGVEFFNKFVLLEGILKTDAHTVREAHGAGLDTYKDLKNLVEHSQNKDELMKWLSQTSTKYTDEDSGIEALYNEYKVSMIKLGGYQTHFTGSFASGDAIGITKQYLNRGASAIIAVAGPQSLDSAQEIQNQKSDCIVIGVDTAMEEGQYQRKFGKSGFEDATKADDGSAPAQADSIIKFSAVKDMTTVTKKFLNLCAQNKNFDVAKEAEDPRDPGSGKKIQIADPDRSICGVGFRTCGNIRNGLISISFDGWHPFVSALRHLKFGSNDLKAAWKSAALAYFNKTEGDLSPVEQGIADIDVIDTYNKDKLLASNETVYKHYSQIMAILGVLLNGEDGTKNKFDFKNMSVDVTLDDNMNVTKAVKTPDDQASMTILDWLAKNMYFTC